METNEQHLQVQSSVYLLPEMLPPLGCVLHRQGGVCGVSLFKTLLCFRNKIFLSLSVEVNSYYNCIKSGKLLSRLRQPLLLAGDGGKFD